MLCSVSVMAVDDVGSCGAQDGRLSVAMAVDALVLESDTKLL
jgi:hypothetical protein